MLVAFVVALGALAVGHPLRAAAQDGAQAPIDPSMEPLTEARLLAWFEAERAQAIDPEPLGNVRLDYEIYEYAPATPELLAEWKRDAEGNPEHPNLGRIAAAERRLRDGPDSSHGSIWWPHDDAWRQNVEPSRPTPGIVTFGDKGQRAGRHWRLFEHSVVLEDPGSPAVQSEIHGLRYLLAMFLHGGLYAGATSELTVASIDGDAWSIKAVSANGWSRIIHGSWDPDLGRGFVRRIEERPADEGWPVHVWTFEDYAVDPVLARWVATRVDHQTGDGPEQARMEYVFAGVQAVESGRMAEILRVPSIGREDAIRGLIASGTEQDVREGVTRKIDESGRVTATDRVTRPASTSPVLRIIGIVAAVGIVGVLIWIRVRR